MRTTSALELFERVDLSSVSRALLTMEGNVNPGSISQRDVVTNDNFISRHVVPQVQSVFSGNN